MKSLTPMLLVFSGALFSASAANAMLIDFSTAVIPGVGGMVPGNMIGTNPYVPFVASGFNFQDESDGYNGYLVSGAMNGNFVVPSGHDLYATFLHPTGGGKFYAADGNAFTLNSLNLNWWDYVWDAVPHPYTVTGTFTDGSTQSVSGSVNPGQFAALTLNWAGVTSVAFAGSAGAAWDGGGFIGISDVTVNVGSSVPEPGTWAMLLAGLGLTLLRGAARAAAAQDGRP